jgi:hypothetical protein
MLGNDITAEMENPDGSKKTDNLGAVRDANEPLSLVNLADDAGRHPP